MRPSISTFMFIAKRVSRSLARNSISISTAGSTVRARGSSTMRTSSALSSRTSARIGIFFEVDELGEPLDQLALLHLVGDLGDDDLPGAAAEVLDRPARAQPEAAAAGAVGLLDRRRAARR